MAVERPLHIQQNDWRRRRLHEYACYDSARLADNAYVPEPEILVATSWNFDDKLEPIKVNAEIKTTAIKAAIKPYSMAVTPESSRRNLRINFLIIILLTRALGPTVAIWKTYCDCL
jgi:hypothetical protein